MMIGAAILVVISASAPSGPARDMRPWTGDLPVRSQAVGQASLYSLGCRQERRAASISFGHSCPPSCHSTVTSAPSAQIGFDRVVRFAGESDRACRRVAEYDAGEAALIRFERISGCISTASNTAGAANTTRPGCWRHWMRGPNTADGAPRMRLNGHLVRHPVPSRPCRKPRRWREEAHAPCSRHIAARQDVHCGARSRPSDRSWFSSARAMEDERAADRGEPGSSCVSPCSRSKPSSFCGAVRDSQVLVLRRQLQRLAE